MAPRQFESFLERSLELLSREKAAVFARLCRTLDGMVLAMRIDDESVAVRFCPLPQVFCGACDDASVHVRSGRRAILDVISGDVTLERAVLEDRIELAGSVASLVRFHDGLRIYLSGAVRAPRFPTLLDDYLAAGQPDGVDTPPIHGDSIA